MAVGFNFLSLIHIANVACTSFEISEVNSANLAEKIESIEENILVINKELIQTDYTIKKQTRKHELVKAELENMSEYNYISDHFGLRFCRILSLHYLNLLINCFVLGSYFATLWL